MKAIEVRGARAHNLRGIDVSIPHGKLTVVTGPSGSGKSSLAFDTIYAEAQRRLTQALGTRDRSGLALLPAPDVDAIEHLPPALAVAQEPLVRSPRSTIGTVSEIHDHLRVLFARLGTPHCPRCGSAVRKTTPPEIVDALLAMPEGTRFTLLAPLDHLALDLATLAAQLRHRGFTRLAIGGVVSELDSFAPPKEPSGAVEVVVDRLVSRPGSRSRTADSVELALREGAGVLRVQREGGPDDERYTARATCLSCGFALPEIGPRTFSWSSPEGACPACRGRGELASIDAALCVRDASLSIDDGAITAWGEPGGARHKAMLKQLRAAIDVPTSVPFSSLPEATRTLVLEGGVLAPKGKKKGTAVRWEGVVPLLDRALAELAERADDDEEVWARIEDELGAFTRSKPCGECGGSRLGPVPRGVRLWGTTIDVIGRMDLSALGAFLDGIVLEGRDATIGAPLLREVRSRAAYLGAVGVSYLALDRATSTLSAGEAQRIRMASVLGSGLSSMLFVLDEPTQGLHPTDVAPLVRALREKTEREATVLVVEHDLSVIRAADHVIELGPGAGRTGGSLVASGTPDELAAGTSATAKYLRAPPEAPPERPAPKTWMEVRGATLHNLDGVTARFASRALTVVCGPSGAGKSSLATGTLLPLAGFALGGPRPAVSGELRGAGAGAFSRIVSVDEAPMGRSGRSTPATFSGVMGPIRELFATLPEAKARGWDASRFSWNVPGGRCERCEGEGAIRVRMHLVPDVWVPCPLCEGRRYERETLEVRWRGMNVADVLAASIDECCELFSAIPSVLHKLTTLRRLGLGYLALGQRATTISGGEAQRLALARELSKKGDPGALYVLDEPTRGLHAADVDVLADVLAALADEGHTVVVVTHAPAIVRIASHVVELGPGGGPLGGRVVFQGTPAELSRADTATGRALR